MRTLIALIIIWPLTAFAQLNPPAPSEAKGSAQKQEQATKPDEKTCKDKKCPDVSPITVNVSPTQTINAQPSRKSYHEENESSAEWLVALATVALALITSFLAFFTLKLWRSTGEIVADNKDFSKKQLRAYVTIVVGNALYQDRKNNLKFQARPMMVNTGKTPAHDVGFKAKAAILPVPLPENFDFPVEGTPVGQSVLGAGHNFDFGPAVDAFVDDSEIDAIKNAQGKALFTWGTVFYTDIFGERHLTEFCQMVCWTPDNKIYGYYDQRHNKAT